MATTTPAVVDEAILSGRPLSVSLIRLPDTETAVLWARIKSRCEKKGRPITFADAWIAASAVQLNVPLVTHNASDYAAVEDLTILTVSAVT